MIDPTVLRIIVGIVVIFLLATTERTDSPKSVEPVDSDNSAEQDDVWEKVKGFAGYLLDISLTCYLLYTIENIYFFLHHLTGSKSTCKYYCYLNYQGPLHHVTNHLCGLFGWLFF